jgi:hypothetical protein
MRTVGGGSLGKDIWKSGLERYVWRGDGQSIGAPLGWVRSRHPHFPHPSAILPPVYTITRRPRHAFTSARLDRLDVVQQAQMAG